MTVEEITQEINIIMMRLNVEDNPERKSKLETELKKLNFKKEIAVIKQKIDQLS